jgi:hypothetical protein
MADCSIFLKRVLSRESGSHTLTKDTKIQKFKSVKDFFLKIFANPCIAFVPAAQLLPGTVVLDDMFQPGTEAINANCLADRLMHWETCTSGK